MACALWLPNVELIFAITGSTASVTISYILPAIVFMRLLDKVPELSGALRGARQGFPAWG